MRKLKELTEEQEYELFKRRETGELRKDLLNEYGISEREYKKIILKNGGELNKKVNKYSFNEDYFEKIDTEDKAYFLGFIVADGCVRKSDKSNFMKIKLKYDDYKILEDFIKYTAYAGGVYYHKNKKYCELTLSGVKMVSDLNNLGICQNKTMIVKYPNIPECLEHHFMRGFFDGDGCISIHKKREDSKDITDRGQVNICSASIDFIEKYVDRLNEICGITKNKIRCPRGTYSVIDWGSFSDIEKFYDLFYKDATVYLERKKKTFEVAVSISNSKIKYRKKQ
jgi:hypothetical protein